VSSSVFVVTIRSSEVLRQTVLLSGAGLGLLGAISIAMLPLDVEFRAFGAAAWLLVTGRDVWRLSRGYRRYRSILVDERGQATLCGPPGPDQAAELTAGSVLLQGVGWLRFRADDGTYHAELVAGNLRKNKDWRRLQVIWRHL